VDGRRPVRPAGRRSGQRDAGFALEECSRAATVPSASTRPMRNNSVQNTRSQRRCMNTNITHRNFTSESETSAANRNHVTNGRFTRMIRGP